MLFAMSFSIPFPDGWLQSLPGMTAGSSYVLTRFIFLRFLGVIYLIAFASLWVQIRGLIGGHGILPIADFLQAVREQLGPERYRLLPTVFWLNASDTALTVVCALGVFFSCLLIVGIAPAWSLLFLWILYLSLTTAGRDFLSFQWDILLLEVGFLAIFFAPWSLLPGLARETAISPLALFLLLFLLFRFTLESGVVKLTSGDSSWRDLTALTYHYFTQPLPAWTSWYVQQLPLWFHKLSMIVMYSAELVLPLLMFASRPLRLLSAAGMILFQILIGATGNYTFFNLLTIALCGLLLDDAFFSAVLPDRLLTVLHFPVVPHALPSAFILFIPVAALLFFVGTTQLLATVFPRMQLPAFTGALDDFLSPFRSVNAYGLFRVMTKERPEIVIEGSNDGATWLPYEFPWKPGDPTRRPQFIEPHQPRLDWQMWFAVLSPSRPPRWFQSFLARLLEGSPDVLALLEKNPFLDAPPRYVRALLYHYEFTTPEEKSVKEEWWKRELRGVYHPAVSLE